MDNYKIKSKVIDYIIKNSDDSDFKDALINLNKKYNDHDLTQILNKMIFNKKLDKNDIKQYIYHIINTNENGMQICKELLEEDI